MSINCWEFKGCGREPDGVKVDELGICPASTEKRLNGIHNGVNSGRACWIVAGTLCDGKEQGTYAEKEHNCIKCDFYKLVSEEEIGNFVMSHTLKDKLKAG